MIQELIYGGVLLPLARHAPRASRALRPAFARLAWVGHPAWRRSLRANARILLGPDSTPAAQDRLGLEVLRQVQEVIAEVATIDRRSVASLAADFRRLDGLQHVRPFLERKRPLILGGAHLGSFESSVAALRRWSDVPVHVLSAQDPVRAFDRARRRARLHLGIREHRVGDGVGAWLELQRALERGEMVALLVDRVQPGQQAAVRPFLGAPALVPTGAVRLAAMSGVPIVPVFCVPEGEARILRFRPPLEVPAEAAAAGAAQEGALATLLAYVEEEVRAHPGRWLAVHPHWVETPFPAGAGSR
ncbi:MAG: lysophospholipid acyltransferase family protein [Phycisphaerales bacterium]